MESLHSFGSSCDRLLELLVDARRKGGMSAEDVAGQSGLKLEHIEAIDEGRLDFLPPPYVVSELRQYAVFLGVGNDELFDEVKKEANIPVLKIAPELKPGSQHPQDAGNVPLVYVLVSAGILMLLVLFWLGAGLFSGDREEVDGAVFVAESALLDEAGEAVGERDAVFGLVEDVGEAMGDEDLRVPGEPVAATVLRGQDAGVEHDAVDAEPDVVEAAWPAMVRGQFATFVDRARREPVDAVEQVSLAEGEVYFFSEISGQKGKRVVHAWYHEGQLADRIDLGWVSSDSWRGWSMKKLYPSRVGVWRVVVENGSGEKLGEASLVVEGEK